MPASYARVPARSSANPNASADVNQLQDNTTVLKGGDPDVAPTKSVEEIIAQVDAAILTGTDPIITKSLGYSAGAVPDITLDGSAVGYFNLLDGDMATVTMDESTDSRLVYAGIRRGAFSLLVTHATTEKNLLLAAGYYQGVTGSAAISIPMPAGATKKTVVNFQCFDGATMLVSTCPFYA